MTTFAPAFPVPAVAAPISPGPEVIDPLRRRLRRLIWVFIALWIVEGALRKWILPGLANPLLVVRDPVLLLIYFYSFGRRGLFPVNPFVLAVLGLGTVAAMISLVITNTPAAVVAYGFRANFLHLPLIFLFPRVLDRGDVLRVGRWLLLASGPMAVIVLGQFVAPTGSWLNAGAGGGAEGQMSSAMGHVRASGTFSFTNGLVGFTALVSAFTIYRTLLPQVYAKVFWLLGVGSLVVMTALSGNRAVVGIVGLTVGALLVVTLVRPAFLRAAWKVLAVGVLVVLALGSFAVFRQGVGVFAERFGDEQSVRVGFVGRYFQGVYIAPSIWRRARLEGLGLGIGTNAGAGILTGGKRDMLLAEGEWDRMILELGPPLGCLYLGLRVLLTLHLLRAAWRSFRGDGDPLPILLVSGCYSDVLFGQLAQPTSLGFVCIAGGLTLAATRAPGASVPGGPASKPRPAAGAMAVPVEVAAAPTAVGPGPRGRSRYAELLNPTRRDSPDPERPTPGNQG